MATECGLCIHTTDPVNSLHLPSDCRFGVTVGHAVEHDWRPQADVDLGFGHDDGRSDLDRIRHRELDRRRRWQAFDIKVKLGMMKKLFGNRRMQFNLG